MNKDEINSLLLQKSDVLNEDILLFAMIYHPRVLYNYSIGLCICNNVVADLSTYCNSDYHECSCLVRKDCKSLFHDCLCIMEHSKMCKSIKHRF